MTVCVVGDVKCCFFPPGVCVCICMFIYAFLRGVCLLNPFQLKNNTRHTVECWQHHTKRSCTRECAHTRATHTATHNTLQHPQAGCISLGYTTAHLISAVSQNPWFETYKSSWCRCSPHPSLFKHKGYVLRQAAQITLLLACPRLDDGSWDGFGHSAAMQFP